MASIFGSTTTIRDIVEDALRSNVNLRDRNRKSMLWLAERARQMNSRANNASTFIREDGHTLLNKGNEGIGKMFLYFYDAKHKATLPYYDQVPCIFVLERYKDGFLGLNLHYLAYRERAFLLDALFELENNAKLPENKKLRLRYAVLKTISRSELAMPCIKRYLYSQVRSRFVRVPADEWHIVAMLPYQAFRDGNGKTIPVRKVWADSRRAAKKRQRKGK
ncbi:DNA end protector protein [Ochrobactrum phage vB_OspM_OC]|nr:DNA end protector protein [Ochrobactrum phage vB_OspM_OC]